MKLKTILLFIFLFLLSGCTNNITAKEAVKNYLEDYRTLDNKVVNNLDTYIDKENMTKEQKKIYKEILIKQYTSLSYKFTKETYIEDEAFINAEITVLDLLNPQKESSLYLKENPSLFQTNNQYDQEKFLNYKLSNMQNVTTTITYNIEFNVKKEGKKWQVVQLSNADLLKIHGIYET